MLPKDAGGAASLEQTCPYPVNEGDGELPGTGAGLLKVKFIEKAVLTPNRKSYHRETLLKSAGGSNHDNTTNATKTFSTDSAISGRSAKP